MKTNNTVGVIVGRFHAPAPHEAHLKLFKEVISHHDEICVCLGVSPLDVRLPENPLSFRQRAYILSSHLPQTATIIPVLDQKDDAVWSKILDETLARMYPTKKPILYGGRDSFLKRYSGTCDAVEVPEYTGISATEIRRSIPERVNPEFINGQIYGINAAFPRVNPTVDIAVIHDRQVLLIRRADTGTWALPGGFVDRLDMMYREAASRELFEELRGIPLESQRFTYVTDMKLDDWRYRSSRDSVHTTLFRVEVNPAEMKAFSANPEEVSEFGFFSYDDALLKVDLHKPLIQWLMTNPEGEA